MSLDSIFSDDWPEDHRSGVVVVVGRPNVGKSTLINAILDQKIAIATPKPQTTRRNQLGIYTIETGQILFTDTPGLHKPHNKLGEYMMHVAEGALRGADVILWIMDGSEAPQKADEYIAQTIQNARRGTPVLLVLNKIDRIVGTADFSAHLALIQPDHHIAISATEKTGVDDLLAWLMGQMPYGPRYYPAEQVSDLNMRFVAAEIVREKVILNTHEEVPHSVAVGIDHYSEGDDSTVIDATIYVEKDSQKGIIIGKKGSMIKQIGTAARQDLIAMLERPVHLELHVKVLKNWRSNEQFMKRMGYFIPKDDD